MVAYVPVAAPVRRQAGLIREQYLVTPFDTQDESDLVTEVCWPVLGAVAPDLA